MTREMDPPLRRASAHEQRRIDRYHAHPAKAHGIQRERLTDLCGLLTLRDRELAGHGGTRRAIGAHYHL